MKQIVLVALCAIVLAGCQSVTRSNPDAKFEALANEISDYRSAISVNGKLEAVNGYWLENLSKQHLADKFAKNSEFLQKLDTIDRTQLSADNQINVAILTAQVKNSVDQYRFNAHMMPLTSEYGFHSGLSFLASRHDFSQRQGFEVYLARLAAIPRYFEQNMMWMREGIARGITQPKAVLTGYQDSIAAFIVKDATESEFFRPFTQNTAGLDEAEFAQLQQRARTIISAKVIPAYQAYYDFFMQSYLPNARDDIAVSSIENGLAYYQNRAEYYTTTKFTIDEIHQLGLAEVARIKAEMQSIIDEVGFDGDFAAFIAFLRSDPQFYAKTPQALLEKAAFYSKQADAQLPKFFKHLPRTPYGVAPVPASIAPKYTTGRYISPSNDKTPGYYWVNTHQLDKRPLYVLEALTLHEAVPGHHLQITLNRELTDLPGYRRNSYISAFGEGWGLYSEYLGLEMGFYTNPYNNFGRLTYEMWRAMRLVVDTGMHAKGWTRQQALDFMAQNSALSTHNIKTEVDRYISWPGQALSYKIGELTIKRLRKEAEAALGSAFDIREFHFRILRNGAVPLAVLEQQIADYIAETKAP